MNSCSLKKKRQLGYSNYDWHNQWGQVRGATVPIGIQQPRRKLLCAGYQVYQKFQMISCTSQLKSVTENCKGFLDLVVRRCSSGNRCPVSSLLYSFNHFYSFD